MQVKDLKFNNEGIFHYINIHKPLPLNNAKVLDCILIGLHGKRLVSPLVENIVDNVDEESMLLLGEVFSNLLSDKWCNMKVILDDVVTSDTYRLITTETIDDVGGSNNQTERNNSSMKLEKVSGYNSNIMVDDESDDITDVESTLNTGSNNNKRERVSTVTGNIRNVLQDKERALNYLDKNTICDILITDVSKLIATLIY